MTRGAEFLLHDAGRAIDEIQSLNESDVWASSIQSAFRPSAFETAPFCDVFDALSAASGRGGNAAAALAAAIAVYGPVAARPRARRLYLRLVERGVEVPEWVESLGIATPVKAICFTDEWDDERLVSIDFTRPDGTTIGLFVVVELLLGGVAHNFGSFANAEEFRTAVSDIESGMAVEVDLAEARAIVEAGLRQRESWSKELLDVEDDEEEAREVYESDEDLLALVEQWITLLPDGGDTAVPSEIDPDAVGEMVADFFMQQNGEISSWEGEAVIDICSFSSSCYKSDLLTWSPKKTLALLIRWEYTDRGEDQDGRKGMESVLPKWLEYSAQRRGLDPEGLDVNLYVADRYFRVTRRRALALPGADHGGCQHFGCMEDADIDYSNREAVRAWAERR
ncbi:hypothetical protein [Candidatus Poriferisocius sp.]|uniref:hypothetical protein n=1 Tax=Candidatus Poriferisocius sp. TaxID=3101276 RepID=UPI003B02B83C